MKKIIFHTLFCLLVTIFSNFIIYNTVLAQNATSQSPIPNLQNAFGENSVVNQVGGNAGYQIISSEESENRVFYLIGQIINLIFSVLGLIFVILTIFAGYHWMTAAGNDEQVNSAKKSLKQSIIGLVIIVLTWGTWAIISNLANLF